MANELNFFITTDIHMGASDCGAEDYEVSLKNMREIDPEAPLVIPGDFTTFSDPIWFNEVHRMLKDSQIHPVLMTLGNHDVRGRKEGNTENVGEDGWIDMWKRNWINGKDSEDDPRFGIFKKIVPLYQDMIADLGGLANPKLFTHHILNGYHFFMLCTERGLKDKCYLSQEQLNWLNDGIKAARKEDATKPIFIFSHQALNDTHLGSDEYGGFGDENDELLAILNQYSNLIFLSGHIHNGLKIAQDLHMPFGYAFDLASYTTPDNGLKKKGVGYYVNVKENHVNFYPYFLGDYPNPKAEALPLYNKTLYFN